MQTLVTIQENKLVTTSKLVAEAFEKSHKNVVRDIENLDCSQELRKLNFELSYIEQPMPLNRGFKKVPVYNITRDGFTFLAMGYTGKRAAEFKEAYIKAFNEMEGKLKNDQSLAITQYVANTEKKLSDLQLLIQDLAKQILSMKSEPKAIDVPTYYSVKEYLNSVGKKLNSRYTGAMGRECSKYCRANGLEVKKYNTNSLYPVIALEHMVRVIEERVRDHRDADIAFLKTNKTAQQLKLLLVGEYLIFHKKGKHSRTDVYDVVRRIENWTEFLFEVDTRDQTFNPSIKVTRLK